jgi:glyoxylase-like metal-dependent hydrolase (beta-lactamase superfamily II)
MPPFSELGPGLRRLVAPNPSMMTGPGTNTYLFGSREVAVLDPGPVIDSHLETIQQVAEAPIRWILVTHTHPDHSPAAGPLAAATGAELLGMPAPDGKHQDATFKADRVLADGDELATGEFVIEAVHTPGHASNHLSYRHVGKNWLFTGDHVIDGSTVVIDPPDGDMSHYLESLQRVKDLQCKALAPGHGEIINDPDRILDHSPSVGKRGQSGGGTCRQSESHDTRTSAARLQGCRQEAVRMGGALIIGTSIEARD